MNCLYFFIKIRRYKEGTKNSSSEIVFILSSNDIDPGLMSVVVIVLHAGHGVVLRVVVIQQLHHVAPFSLLVSQEPQLSLRLPLLRRVKCYDKGKRTNQNFGTLCEFSTLIFTKVVN